MNQTDLQMQDPEARELLTSGVYCYSYDHGESRSMVGARRCRCGLRAWLGRWGKGRNPVTVRSLNKSPKGIQEVERWFKPQRKQEEHGGPRYARMEFMSQTANKQPFPLSWR